MTAWWLGLSPAQAVIACSGATHALRWEDGGLTALDHDDVEGERTLAALGDERCACIDALDAWRRHADDLRVLVLGSRGPIDLLAVGPEQPSGWTAYAYAGSGGGGWDDAPRDDLVTLLQLGGGLPDRLAATVAAAWADRVGQGDAPPAALHAALYGRVTAAIRAWLGEADLKVELRLIGEDEQPGLARDGDRVVAALPLTWLTGVWAAGHAVTGGRFCLAATTADGRRWTLTTTGPELGATAQLAVELPG